MKRFMKRRDYETEMTLTQIMLRFEELDKEIKKIKNDIYDQKPETISNNVYPMSRKLDEAMLSIKALDELHDRVFRLEHPRKG